MVGIVFYMIQILLDSYSHPYTYSHIISLNYSYPYHNFTLNSFFRLILTWASVATTNPKVNAICGIVDWKLSNPDVVLLIPTETRKNVPKNSAIKHLQMLRLSVMSAMPMTFFKAAKRNDFFYIQCLCSRCLYICI